MRELVNASAIHRPMRDVSNTPIYHMMRSTPESAALCDGSSSPSLHTPSLSAAPHSALRGTPRSRTSRRVSFEKLSDVLLDPERRQPFDFPTPSANRLVRVSNAAFIPLRTSDSPVGEVTFGLLAIPRADNADTARCISPLPPGGRINTHLRFVDDGTTIAPAAAATKKAEEVSVDETATKFISPMPAGGRINTHLRFSADGVVQPARAWVASVSTSAVADETELTLWHEMSEPDEAEQWTEVEWVAWEAAEWEAWEAEGAEDVVGVFGEAGRLKPLRDATPEHKPEGDEAEGDEAAKKHPRCADRMTLALADGIEPSTYTLRLASEPTEAAKAEPAAPAAAEEAPAADAAPAPTAPVSDEVFPADTASLVTPVASRSTRALTRLARQIATPAGKSMRA